MQVRAVGAAGSAGAAVGDAVGGAGGAGDGVSGALSNLAGGSQGLYVCVDQGGGQGGPANNNAAGGGSGGGASGVGLGADFATPAVVAAGGGGGGAGFGMPGFPDTGDGGSGGAAGIPAASPGTSPLSNLQPGGGGDNSSRTGGVGGSAPNPGCSGTSGSASSSAGPGAGGAGITTICGSGGGGGGAGYFGGGAGASSGFPAAGGGGGSDFCSDAVVGCVVTTGAGTETTAGQAPGQAQVTLTYVTPDETGPVDAPVVSPVANANGWNNTDVSVVWDWTDAGSGVDSASCTQASVSSGEGVQTLSASCSDLAGNTSSDSRQVKVDTTGPVDAPVVTTTATGASLAWNWSDALSGVDPSSCTQSSSQTGTGQLTFTSSCTDLAGNTATDSKTVTVSAPATKAALQLTVTGPTSAARNSKVTYAVTVRNAGPATAANVVTKLWLPCNAVVVSATGSPVHRTSLLNLETWTAPSIAAGTTVTYLVTTRFTAANLKPGWVLAGATESMPTRTAPATPDLNPVNNLAMVTTRVS